MRANRSKSGKRRSHAALALARVAKCECGALRLSHRACSECGKYNGHIIIDIVARAKREARRATRKEKDLRASGQQTESKKEEHTSST